jgi:outer membrane lipoprotein carrier protein
VYSKGVSQKTHLGLLLGLISCYFTTTLQLVSEQIELPAQFKCQAPIQASNDLVNKLQSFLRSIKNFGASFYQQSFTIDFDDIDSASGKIYFQKPSKFRFDYKSPENKTFLLLDKNSFMIDNDNGRVESEVLDKEQVAKFPLSSVLAGNLSEHFELVSLCMNSDGVLFRFLRRENGNQTYELHILTDSSVKTLQGVLFKDFGGAVNLFIFKDQTTNNLPESLFYKPKT